MIQSASFYPSSVTNESKPSPGQLCQAVCLALEALKAQEVTCLDVHESTSMTDFFVIASGTSTRHVKAIADEVIRQAKQLGVKPLGCEGEREGEWILVDLADVVVHIMLPAIREFYALERLWKVGGEALSSVDKDVTLHPGRVEREPLTRR